MNKKLQVCKWHKCDIGYQYHHTGEEWDQHQQYARTDIPKMSQPSQVYDMEPNQIRVGAMPEGYSSTPCIAGKHDDKWRMIALGTTIAVWGMIILTVWRLWV